jgi:hypothetical protein
MRRKGDIVRVPGAAQHECEARSGALQTREPGFSRMKNHRGPGSAVHRSALHRVRDTSVTHNGE